MGAYVYLDSRDLDNYDIWKLPDKAWRRRFENIINDPGNRRSDYKDERNKWITIRKKVAPLVYARDGHICSQCGATTDLTIDHVIPLARCGTHELENLQVLCRKCNSSKGAK